MKDLNRKLKYFIQVNIGNEMQKSSSTKSVSFLKYCKDEIKLNVIGLMVLPPNDDNTEKYFSNVSQLNYELGLKVLAWECHQIIKWSNINPLLRIGSEIF